MHRSDPSHARKIASGPVSTNGRRWFLRTACGAAAIPWLESFSDGKRLLASDASASPPTRFVTLFFPNGVYPSAWDIRSGMSDDRSMVFGGSLQPLQPFADRSIVVSGLNNPLGGHLGQTSGFLSGVDFAPDATGSVRGAASLDQMLAKSFAAESYLPSLNLALEPPSQGGFGNRPRSYGNSISWSSATSKIEPQINPQQAFDQVFFGQSAAGRRAADRRRRIVDTIWSEATNLRNRISAADEQKLSQYLDSIHDLETRIDKTLDPAPRTWTPPQTAKPERPIASGIPNDHETHMRMMLEIMLLALQTDSTRVATLVMGHSISRIVYDFVDRKLKRNHHDYSHHRNDPDKIDGYNQITRWLAAQAAWFLERMDSIDEGNGTLLDNSVVLYGSGMKDGNVHEGVDVPVALFGNAGGRLRTGRHIQCPVDSQLSQLHLSLLRLFGVESRTFNGVTSETVPSLI